MSASGLPIIAGAHRLIVVVGPSGAGKDSVLGGWRAALGEAAPAVARRVITRAPDGSEAHEAVTPGDLRRVDGSVDANLTLVNDGDLGACVAALARWWETTRCDAP